MKEAKPLTQEQRKEFIQLLKDAKTRVLDDLADRRCDRFTDAFYVAVRELAEKLGATKLFEQAATAKKTLKDAEKSLRNLGLSIDSQGDPELTSDGSERHGRDVRTRQLQILKDEVEAARKKFELSILGVLATESVEDAKMIVEVLV